MSRRLVAVALLLVLVVGGGWWSLRERGQRSLPPVLPSSGSHLRKHGPDEGMAVVSDKQIRDEIFKNYRDLLKWLATEPIPGEQAVHDRLLSLRERWAAMDATALAEALAELLENGEDQNLPLAFEVGLHGFLDGWPTVRVFLLDVLVAADPVKSGEVARKILDHTRSAEEYAMALRPLARKDLGVARDGELLVRMDRMLGEPMWQRSPGLAEALDVARVIGSSEAARHLLAWSGDAGLKQMALDEFAAEHPAETLEALAADQELAEKSRAELMARADPRDPVQRDSVNAYLRKESLSAEEATAFLRAFPLRSASTGNRLYGELPSPYRLEDVATGDQAALHQVELWSVDPALRAYLPEIQALQGRLHGWVEQAR